MSMFCYQCQETTRDTGCTTKGICGKTGDVSHLYGNFVGNYGNAWHLKPKLQSGGSR